jgi:hypothetical protein
VPIDKGMKHGQKIVFSGEADEQVGASSPLGRIGEGGLRVGAPRTRCSTAVPCGAVRSRVAGRPMSVVLSVQPGQQAGDIIFVIDQSPHAVFTRHGDSLSITKRIKLVEALCGPNMQCNDATMLRRSATASPAHVHAYWPAVRTSGTRRCPANAAVLGTGNKTAAASERAIAAA